MFWKVLSKTVVCKAWKISPSCSPALVGTRDYTSSSSAQKQTPASLRSALRAQGLVIGSLLPVKPPEGAGGASGPSPQSPALLREFK